MIENARHSNSALTTIKNITTQNEKKTHTHMHAARVEFTATVFWHHKTRTNFLSEKDTKNVQQTYRRKRDGSVKVQRHKRGTFFIDISTFTSLDLVDYYWK